MNKTKFKTGTTVIFNRPINEHLSKNGKFIIYGEPGKTMEALHPTRYYAAPKTEGLILKHLNYSCLIYFSSLNMTADINSQDLNNWFSIKHINYNKYWAQLNEA